MYDEFFGGGALGGVKAEEVDAGGQGADVEGDCLIA